MLIRIGFSQNGITWVLWLVSRVEKDCPTPREYKTRDGTPILDFQAALLYLLTRSEFPNTAASLSPQPRAARDGVSTSEFVILYSTPAARILSQNYRQRTSPSSVLFSL
jgi:hypothetical protein